MISFLTGLMNLFLGTCIILLIIVILSEIKQLIGMMINKGVGIILLLGSLKPSTRRRTFGCRSSR